jgi:hypothetical protein
LYTYIHHRDTENTEGAQRKDQFHAKKTMKEKR